MWICPLNVCLYQTVAEQLGCCVSVGQVDEGQSSYCDRGPEYAVQTAGGLMTHQQRRGHCVGVDEGSVGALRWTKQSGRMAQRRGFQVGQCAHKYEKVATATISDCNGTINYSPSPTRS